MQLVTVMGIQLECDTSRGSSRTDADDFLSFMETDNQSESQSNNGRSDLISEGWGGHLLPVSVIQEPPAQPVLQRAAAERGGEEGVMAETAAVEAAPTSKQQLSVVFSGALSADTPAPCGQSVCGSCLQDKGKVCPDESGPTDGVKQNGTRLKLQ
ncbi:hypothetical protein INR49_003238 [Caranx melampygus]|nr:hypothetical protein INR49_003238 [Caranx melampygus]